ncbi:MAG: hypothetical protein LBI87_05065 [Candidatus Accumulibacter sp.]|jgi:hypothetical protein|nr:hypothetical protein [Accumulibacter sp.]
MQTHEIKDPYVMPPQGETLRQYYLRRGYLGRFDDLDEPSLMSLEQERKAAISLAEMAKTGPMVFGHEDHIYKRFPDGRIELVRRG